MDFLITDATEIKGSVVELKKIKRVMLSCEVLDSSRATLAAFSRNENKFSSAIYSFSWGEEEGKNT